MFHHLSHWCSFAQGLTRNSLRKWPSSFRDATTGFPAKWRLRNEGTNSMLMMRQYLDLVSASNHDQSEALTRSSDASSVWNFYAHFSYAISRGNQCWRREMTAFSQALDVCTKFCLSSEKSIILSAASVIKAWVWLYSHEWSLTSFRNH